MSTGEETQAIIAPPTFATAAETLSSIDWLRSQLDAAREQNQELLRQNCLLENRAAGLELEVARYRKLNGGKESV